MSFKAHATTYLNFYKIYIYSMFKFILTYLLNFQGHILSQYLPLPSCYSCKFLLKILCKIIEFS